jgi:hypothetical protein
LRAPDRSFVSAFSELFLSAFLCVLCAFAFH